MLTAVQRWYSAGGYGGRGMPKDQVKAKHAPLGTMSDTEVSSMFTRFMEWFAAGRPGDPLKGGKEVSKAAAHTCSQPIVG
jgi:hypothetical protein